MKRLIDIFVSILMLLFLSPLLLGIFILVRIKLGSPALFYQVRSGLGGKPFLIVKFKTMTDERNIEGDLLPDSARLSSLGQILRSSSLDELPELWNILKGDMSLVGPRPLLMEYLPLYTEDQARRHEVPPGLTGWAQANGRNEIDWDERFRLDVWYVDNQSLLLDLKILFITIKKVALRHGIRAPGEATMRVFEGSKPSVKK